MLPGLTQTHDYKLPSEAKDLLADPADVTVDPITGAVLLLSEESPRIAVCAMEHHRLSLLGINPQALNGPCRGWESNPHGP